MRRPLILPSIALAAGILLGERMGQIYAVTQHPIIGAIPIIGCFSFLIMGKSEHKGSIAFFTIGLGVILMSTYALDWSKAYDPEKTYIVTGRVIRMETIDDRTEIVLNSISFLEDEREEITEHNQNSPETYILATTYDEDLDREILGCKIEISLQLEKPKSAGNSGGFDYRRYLYGRNISAYGRFRTAEIKSIQREVSFIYRLYGYVMKLRGDFLESNFTSGDSRDFAGGILFGRGRAISDDIRNEFMEGGVGHILSVSGLHVGILYALWKKIEQKIKTRHTIIRKGILISLFMLYGTASLWSVSVTRAVLLIIIKETAEIINYRFDSLSAIAFISDMMLLSRPYLIFSNGFQMSFLAIVGINFLRPKFMYLIRKVVMRRFSLSSKSEEKNEFISTLSTMLSVQVLMVPYTIYVYNRISLFGLIDNWFMIAMTGIYVSIGVAGFILDAVIKIISFGSLSIEILGMGIGSILAVLGESMQIINRLFLADGEAIVNVVSPRPYIVAASIFGIMYGTSERFKIENNRYPIKAKLKLTFVTLLSMVLFFVISFNPIITADEIFIDVGQGDSIHLHWDDVNILIDGGGNINYNVGERILKPYLLHMGVDSIDMALSTHEHTDHFLGLRQLSEVYPVEKMVRRGVAGDRIVLDEERYIDILWPIPGYEDSDDENYYSRVFKVTDRGITTLITGDITEEGEKALIEYYNGEELKSHILKVAHHGSKYSTSQAFIEAVSPLVAVISVGDNNYGHPAPDVIENLEGQGIIVYRTDLDGAIGIIIRNGKIFVCGNRRNMRIEEYRAN